MPQSNNNWHALWSFLTSSVVVKSFSLTLLAEWGDRSQIATFLLGASEVRTAPDFFYFSCCRHNKIVLN